MGCSLGACVRSIGSQTITGENVSTPNTMTFFPSYLPDLVVTTVELRQYTEVTNSRTVSPVPSRLDSGHWALGSAAVGENLQLEDCDRSSGAMQSILPSTLESFVTRRACLPLAIA